MSNQAVFNRCILIVCAILTTCGLYGQTFSHLSVDDHLSQNSVYSITQDKQGLMWFGTRDGLNSYDSYQVSVYHYERQNPNSLGSNTINSLLTDTKGRLWVGTSKGVALYRSTHNDFERIPAYAGKDSTVTQLYEDRQHRIWVGTTRGLYLLNEQKKLIPIEKLISTQQKFKNSHIRSLYQDAARRVWVGTSCGMVCLEPQTAGTFRLSHYFLHPSDSTSNNTSNGINAIAEDAQGKLWLGTDRQGVVLFDKQLGLVSSWDPVTGINLSTQSIRTITADRNKGFWIGTMAGLYIVDSQGRHLKTLLNNPADPSSLSDNSVKSLFQDKDGSFWIGTYYGGVDLYNPLAQRFKTFAPVDAQGKTPFKIAGPLLPTEGNKLWLGTEDRGLFLVNANQTIARHYTHDPQNHQSLSNDKVKCILAEGNKGLWIGTLKGLNYLDFQRQTITRYLHDPENPESLPNDRIYDLKRTSDGTLWIVTNYGGLCRFNAQKKTFERLAYDAKRSNSLSSNNSNCLLIDHRQQIWVGTAWGLNKKEVGSQNFTRFLQSDNDRSSLSDNHILCLLEDRQHRIWVGTREGGLNLLLPDGRSFRRYTKAQGFPCRSVFAIQEDASGKLWLTTDAGLIAFDSERSVYKTYNKYDGLVCREFTPNSAYRDTQGNLYFGGYNGIVFFQPTAIASNPKAPAVGFRQVRLFDKPVTSLSGNPIDFKKGITLSHLENVFSIDFAAYNYITSLKNQYAYRLVGFDKQWNYVSQPRALYMNLEPGDYVLQIKASNNDGVWNPQVQELAITVLPPWWKTTWAFALYVLVFLGLLRIWSGFNRKRLQLAHDLQTEHTEKLRQQELHQTKLNFFTEIAHEIRTPLTLVKGPIEVLTLRYPDDPALQKQLGIMRGSTDRLMRLLNQLLDFRKHETGHFQLKRQQMDLVAFLKQGVDSFEEQARSRKIMLTSHLEPAYLEGWLDAQELEKVLSNLVLNALKFTPEGGQITLRLRQESSESDSLAVITVEDSGTGIAAEDLEHIFDQFYQVPAQKRSDTGFGLGLALSKNIIDLHLGKISVESQPATDTKAGFTRFTIFLPLQIQDNSFENTPIQIWNQSIAGIVPDTDAAVPLSNEKADKDKPILLLVEDQQDLRLYMKELFKDEYQVIEATDGAMGWDQASHVLPDLIITDVAMPIMDGFTLVHRLKSDLRTSHIPVIMLTAKDTVDHQLTGLKTGADDYVIKPFHPVLLQARVRNLLQLREQLKARYHQRITLEPQVPILDHPDDKFLNQLRAALDEHLSDPDFNVASLVNVMGMSRPVLFRKIKMLTGLSVIDLLRTTRLKKAELLLKQKRVNVSEIAFAVGFSDPKYFSRAFRAQFGLTPTEYSQQADS